ncbi:hypothetical protein ACFSCX_06395 [Bacillus salitolerans]|uniref:DUF2187 domain-containing protein n=1 Tax=Bacillus salitolerans TaxID=1437434 RepID=A0ABW4LM67_9BACI
MNALGVKSFKETVKAGDYLSVYTIPHKYMGTVEKVHDTWFTLTGDITTHIIDFNKIYAWHILND